VDAGGAFVDGVDAGIAVEQLQGKFVAVAVAAQDLQALADRYVPDLLLGTL
jgi:ketosteroid isomerase-like protein